MKKIKLPIGTVPPKCAWCGEYGRVKFLKVTPIKEKPACLMCYNMMTMHIADIKKDISKTLGEK